MRTVFMRSLLLIHAVAHVSGFDEFVAACEAAQTSVTRSFPGPSRRPCEVAASALTTAHALAGERAPQHRKVGGTGITGCPCPRDLRQRGRSIDPSLGLVQQRPCWRRS